MEYADANNHKHKTLIQFEIPTFEMNKQIYLFIVQLHIKSKQDMCSEQCKHIKLPSTEHWCEIIEVNKVSQKFIYLRKFHIPHQICLNTYPF